MKKITLFFLACLFSWLTLQTAAAQSNAGNRSAAVIFAYHRIGEDEYPETNIRREQFAAHIQELVSGTYNVAALPAVLQALKDGETLPDKTVVLTFDGGHKSILQNAVPLLEKHNLPFTLFIPTDHIDRASNEYMDWDDIRNLARNEQVTIGLHPASYIRLYGQPESEIIRQINNARKRFRDELEEEPALFAYPFGEYSNAYRDIIEKQGFDAAFGQQSGVAHAGSDVFSLPRFPMTESYGGLDRFRLTASALPLPVTDIQPRDPLLETTRPSIGFTVSEELETQLEDLSCFVSGQEKPAMEIIGNNRVELRLVKDFESERARLNCTLPVLTNGGSYEDPRWRWFGLLMVIPENNVDQALDGNMSMGAPEQGDG